MGDGGFVVLGNDETEMQGYRTKALVAVQMLEES